MVATGFTNSFTSGEIGDDAWDRVDLQPIAKGCEQATNFQVRIAGPLGKRRGFWDNGAAQDESKLARLIPFRRSIDDALLLEFGDLMVKVWQANGSPLLNVGVPVTFASPYSQAQIGGLRYKQVGDVIYFRHALGLKPQTLTRTDNLTWTFAPEVFHRGPWRNENIDDAFTLAVSAYTGAGLTLTASKPLFDPGMVGTTFRIRGRITGAGVGGWAPGFDVDVDGPDATLAYPLALSNGRVYRDTADIVASKGDYGSNPPVHDAGTASDGTANWEYIHDGAGIVQITAVADSTHATVTTLTNLPTEGIRRGGAHNNFAQTLQPGDNPPIAATPFWAECAYSDFRGWPRMWPAVREERLVSGATAANLDMLDLTQTAGFTPTTEDYTPGLGTGLVTDVDAVRRRLGDDGGELIWAQVATYLVVGSTSGEYLVGANFVDSPISPSAAIVKPVSGFGSADAPAVKVHKGMVYITRGAQTLRELVIDAGQQVTTDDLTVLAQHIAQRGFAKLAWAPQPDETLWCQLADGGLASMVYHQEQAVRGWCGVQLPGGFIVEDLAVLPGPGRLETLWLVVSRNKGGATQRRLWMMSQKTDVLFMDGAQFYAGALATVIGGLGYYEGEEVLVLADGAQVSGLVVAGGAITLPQPAANVMVGLGYTARFKSLNLDVGALQAGLGQRQRVAGALVSILTAQAFVGLDGKPPERIGYRLASDVPATKARRQREAVSFLGDSQREQHVVIEDSTAYDCVLYSLRPQVQVGA